jgi:hypothetical protein
MEIHAPDHPITGWRETVKHLAIITAGVLIALTLEGMVSWVDHRLLVREAEANLTAEIRNNKKELDAHFANLTKQRQQYEQANEVVTTGTITGAFGFMDYGEVSRYADVYDLQAQFMRLQERESEHFADVFAFVRRLVDGKPPAPEALDQWRTQINVALAGLTIREQLGRQLQKRYEELLAGK